MNQDPSHPPRFPSYIKACWAFAQLRFNFIGKENAEQGTNTIPTCTSNQTVNN